jgi:hypothetical protein
MTIDDLVDLLKSRGADSVAYFHTDHFEPWSINIDDESARAVDRMAKLARSSTYARRLSLFYSVFVPYRLASAQALADGDSRVPEDEVVFFARSARQEEIAREAIRPLVREDGHEMHLHIHHEYWTRNHSHFDTPVSKWVNASSTSDADRRRLDLNFRLCRETIAREIGRPFHRWAFIHGNWALNASDPLICHVTNEMAMIMAHGGYGDFSFPAGRSYCDPKLKAPFTCLPLDLVRAYDDPQANPKAIGVGTNAFSRERFFIWNAPIRSVDSSLDYYSAANREIFKTPERLVATWLSRSFLLDGRIFIKTHAHSMNSAYRLTEPDSVIPHHYPDIVRVFECLARVCERARIELRFETANEVVSHLTKLDDGGHSLKPPLSHREASSRPSMGRAATNVTTVNRAKPPTTTPQLVVDELRDLHHRWLQTERGARQVDDLYSLKMRKNTPLETYELALAKHISERYPIDATRIIEIGTGWGGLSILLARLGFEVLSFEGNVERHTACQWHVAEQIKHNPALRGLLQMPRQGLFPEAFSEADIASAKINLCIATNITSSYSASHEAEMITAATACDELILDLARFGATRDKQADRNSFFRALTSSAFKSVERLFFEAPYEYWRLRSQAMPGRRRRKDGALRID